ncbi:hypothetical protein ACIOC1_19700 [Streptomyces sp. NPDC088197]
MTDPHSRQDRGGAVTPAEGPAALCSPVQASPGLRAGPSEHWKE